MFEQEINLQNLPHYFDQEVISQLLENLCREAMEDFKDNPDKTQIQGVHVLGNVPLLGRDQRMYVICLFRGTRHPERDLCELSVDRILAMDSVPDEVLDAFNRMRKCQK